MFRICRLENWMQGIAVNDIIYPQKSLSLSPIGQCHAKRMIRKQFDALRDALESIPCYSFARSVDKELPIPVSLPLLIKFKK
jgi:hypothetical protein